MNAQIVSPAADAETSLLEHCPQCAYSLRGLPTGPHTCPECGFELDRRWKVFGAAPMLVRNGRARRRYWAVRVLPMLYFVFHSAVVLAQPDPVSLKVQVVLLDVFLLTVFWAAIVYRRPRSFLALGAEGIVLIRRRQRVQCYPWPQVGRAQYELISKSIVWNGGEGKVYLEVHPIFSGDMSAVDACVQAINAYPRGNAR